MSKQPPVEWPNTFTIPTRFSVATTSTMKSGVLTAKARDEIVHSLSVTIRLQNSIEQVGEEAPSPKRLLEVDMYHDILTYTSAFIIRLNSLRIHGRRN